MYLEVRLNVFCEIRREERFLLVARWGNLWSSCIKLWPQACKTKGLLFTRFSLLRKHFGEDLLLLKPASGDILSPSQIAYDF